MDYVYPAIFYPEDDGRFSVIFPDLGELATFGDDLADALHMAQDACGMYIFNALREGEKLPDPTPQEQIKKDSQSAFVNAILVDLTEYAKAHGAQSVKKTLSIPAWLNTLCEEQSINYSKVLQEALINKVQSRL